MFFRPLFARSGVARQFPAGYNLLMDRFLRARRKIRNVKHFPIKGITFKDITPLLEDAEIFRSLIDGLAGHFKGAKIDKVVGIDARGFLLASAVAYLLCAGMVIVRKKGKLPYKTIMREHDLEYGKSSLEIHVDAIKKGERILIIDDVLATGGTAGAAVKLVNALHGKIVGLGFLLEITKLGGRKKLRRYRIESLLSF